MKVGATPPEITVIFKKRVLQREATENDLEAPPSEEPLKDEEPTVSLPEKKEARYDGNQSQIMQKIRNDLGKNQEEIPEVEEPKPAHSRSFSQKFFGFLGKR